MYKLPQNKTSAWSDRYPSLPSACQLRGELPLERELLRRTRAALSGSFLLAEPLGPPHSHVKKGLWEPCQAHSDCCSVSC